MTLSLKFAADGDICSGGKDEGELSPYCCRWGTGGKGKP